MPVVLHTASEFQDPTDKRQAEDRDHVFRLRALQVTLQLRPVHIAGYGTRRKRL